MTLFLLVLALLGLGVSLYLLSKKLKNEKIVCFLGKDCDKVLKSKYGKTLGVPNEALGILFYLTVFGGSLLLSQGREITLGLNVLSFLRVTAVLAVLASLYLIGIQALKLKMWCEYCLASAVINGLILLILFI